MYKVLFSLCFFFASIGGVFAYEQKDLDGAYERINEIVNEGYFSSGFVARIAELHEGYSFDTATFEYLSHVRHYASDVLYAVGIGEYDIYLGHKYYFKNGRVFFDRYEVDSADVASFEVIRERYAKDDRCVYFDMNCQRGVN